MHANPWPGTGDAVGVRVLAYVLAPCLQQHQTGSEGIWCEYIRAAPDMLGHCWLSLCNLNPNDACTKPFSLISCQRARIRLQTMKR